MLSLAIFSVNDTGPPRCSETAGMAEVSTDWDSGELGGWRPDLGVKVAIQKPSKPV